MNSLTSSPASRGQRSSLASAGGSAASDPRHLARSWTTRALHLLLLLAVLQQLASSEFMRRPFPGDPPGLLYDLHEYVGLASFVVVLAFWVWTLARRGETRLGRLMPWFSIARMLDVACDLGAQLRRMARGRFPDDSDGAFASAVHGLGLLAVTAMALTGSLFFFTPGTPLGHTALDLHKLIANLVWAYLFVHAGLAVLHHLLGSDIFSRMFWSGRPGSAARRRHEPRSTR